MDFMNYLSQLFGGADASAPQALAAGQQAGMNSIPAQQVGQIVAQGPAGAQQDTASASAIPTASPNLAQIAGMLKPQQPQAINPGSAALMNGGNVNPVSLPQFNFGDMLRKRFGGQ